MPTRSIKVKMFSKIRTDIIYCVLVEKKFMLNNQYIDKSVKILNNSESLKNDWYTI